MRFWGWLLLIGSLGHSWFSEAPESAILAGIYLTGAVIIFALDVRLPKR